MKFRFDLYRYIAIALASLLIGTVIAIAAATSAEADDQIAQIDRFIEHQEAELSRDHEESETVSLSYEEWKNAHLEAENAQNVQKTSLNYEKCSFAAENADVWTLGWELYGISELDTTRSLILISYEAYGPDSPLSYYVACACWARCTDGYFGCDNLYTAFGGLDPQYDLYMDSFGWDVYAEDALREAYLNPVYITGCNGVDSPTEWIYAEETDCGVIYVW